MSQQRRQRRRMVGVTLAPRNTEAGLRALDAAAQVADIAELRLDLMEEYDLNRLLASPPCPVVITQRPEREGGRFTGSERERLRSLYAAIALGADYIDVELDAAGEIHERGQTEVVISAHDFARTPANLDTVYHQLVAAGADIVKVAGMSRSLWDNLQVLRLFQRTRLPIIAIAMGELGLATRVLALRYRHAFLTYASLAEPGEEPPAPGQLPLAAMMETYLARSIRPETQPFGLLGPHAARQHERLKRLNHGLREAGIDGVCVPLPTDVVETSLLQAYVTQAQFRGFFVDEELGGQAPAVVDRLIPDQAGVINVIYADAGGRLTGLHADNPVVRLAQQLVGG